MGAAVACEFRIPLLSEVANENHSHSFLLHRSAGRSDQRERDTQEPRHQGVGFWHRSSRVCRVLGLGERIMTKDQELLELAQQLLDAAHYCTELPRLESHCREIARKLEALAEGADTRPDRTLGESK
jgi:hypothetical protein